MMLEPSLGYLFAHPETVGVTLRHPIALLLLGLLPVFWHLGRRTARAAVWLRLGAFACLTLMLAGLALSAPMPSDRLSVIAAIDLSDSIDDRGRDWSLRYLNDVARSLAPSDEFGVVAFAQNTAVIRSPGEPRAVDVLPRTLDSSATDVAAGLDASLALFAPDTERRLLLLSDGLESRGASRGKIARARRAGVTLYAAIPPHDVHLDTEVTRLLVAPVVGEGTIFPVRVVARNHAPPRPAELTLYADDQALGTERVTLQTGLNAIEIPYRMTGVGGHRLRAELRSTGDDIASNDQQQATVMVVGKLRVMLVTTAAHTPLATVLRRKGIDVEVQSPRQFPTRVEDLLGYHCVIFQDVVGSTIDSKRLVLLDRYVRDFGGGLIFAGSDVSFGDPAFKNSALAQVLPVTLEPRQPHRTEREPLALFVLIDRSNSMGYNSRIHTQRDGEKLRYAKEAALAVIRQLKPHDRVGVIAFDSQAFPLVPLAPVRDNRPILEGMIPRLAEGGGTDFYDALESARQQLSDSQVSTRHIILLTDGDTNRAASDHYPVIEGLRRADISVTTIRIGEDTVNLKLLTDISEKTGGEFYHVESAESLPELMLRDTSERLAQSPNDDRRFLPQLGVPSQILRGVPPKSFPPLTGYAFAKLKPGAEAPLWVLAQDRKDPLLATWQYGLGRVVTFTAGFSSDAETWMGWPAFGKLWSQVVRWSARDQTPWDYGLAVQRRNGKTELFVRSFPAASDGMRLARLHVGDETIDVPLVPTAPRQFSGQLPSLPGGRYPLTIVTRGADRDVDQRTSLILIPDVDEPSREERYAPTADMTLLGQLAEATGGKVNAPIRELVARKPGTRELFHGLDYLLLPLAMMLFLGDVAVRRLTQPPSE